jgi:GST-like protein
MGALGRINDPSFESGAKSQLDTMNKHLNGRDWFCDEYSIADVIPFTRINGVKHETVKVSDYPNVQRWLDRVGARPAVKKAMERKFG